MRITSDKDLLTTLADLESAYSETARGIAVACYQGWSYYEGKQWRSGSGIGWRTTSSGRLYTNYDPNRADLRVVNNITTTLALRVAARTFPSSMEIDAIPGDRSVGSDSVLTQQVCEDATNAMIETSGFIGARRCANMGRTVVGDYAVCLSVDSASRTLNIRGREVVTTDRVLRCHAADPTRFILDPFETSGNLDDHEIVVYQDAWTIHRIRRDYPEFAASIDESKLQTIGELAEYENAVAEITENRLYAQYRKFSKTKGARVYQIHVKGESGRFDQMFVVIDCPLKRGGSSEETKHVINADDPASPFGGSGQPFAMYHGHNRGGSPWSISDVALIIEDQNRRNLAETIDYRAQNNYAAYKWIVDRRFFKTGEIEDAKNQLNNRVGGTVVGEGDKTQGIEGPRIAQVPIPSQTLIDRSDRAFVDASEKVGRPPVTSGQTKSHVPDSTFQTAVNQADQMANVRVMQDVETDARFLTMMLGTTIKCVQQQSPSVISTLQRRGFEVEDLATMLQLDPHDIGMTIVVRQQAVRNRSHELRRKEILEGVQNQVLTPMEVREALSDLDAELLKKDRSANREATRAANAVLRGEEWVPKPLGIWSEFFLNAFRMALMSPIIRYDHDATARVIRAIQSQTALSVQEKIMSDPQAQLQMQHAAMQAAAQPAEGEAAPEGDVMSIPGLIQAINA